MSDIFDQQKYEKEQEELKEDTFNMKEKKLNSAETQPSNICPNQFKKIKIILIKNPAFSIQIPKIQKTPKQIQRVEILLSYKTEIPKKELLDHFLGIVNIQNNLWKAVIATLKNQEGSFIFVNLKAQPNKRFYLNKINLIIQEQVEPATYYHGRSAKEFMEKSLIPNDNQTLYYDHTTKVFGIQKEMVYENKCDLKLQEFLRMSIMVYMYSQDIIARECLHKPIMSYEVWKKQQKINFDQLFG